jgi:hypothetical protein
MAPGQYPAVSRLRRRIARVSLHQILILYFGVEISLLIVFQADKPAEHIGSCLPGGGQPVAGVRFFGVTYDDNNTVFELARKGRMHAHPEQKHRH